MTSHYSGYSSGVGRFCRAAILAALIIPVDGAACQWVGDPFARGRVADAAIAPDGRSIAYTLVTADSGTDSYRGQVMVVPADSGASVAVGPGKMPSWSVAGALGYWNAASDGTYLMTIDSIGSEPRSLGRFAEPTGLRWSPDGSRVALVGRTVPPDSGVAMLPVGPGPMVNRVLVVDVRSGGVETVSDDGFLPGVTFPGIPGAAELDWFDDSTLIVSGRERGTADDASSLHLFDLASGGRSYLAGEGGRWHAPVVSPDREWVAFTGYPLSGSRYVAEELLVLKRDGSGLRRLTVGFDRDVADVVWSPDSRTVWFAAESRGTRNIHRVQVRDGKMETGTTGSHILTLAGLSRRDGFGVAIRETPGDPGALVRFDTGRPWQMRQLAAADVGPPPGQVDEIEFRSGSGEIISGFMRLPPDFDGSSRLPLMVVVHGGPYAMAGMGYSPEATAYAAAGWLVLQLNASGSLGYGVDLANALGSEWPGREVEEIREAVAEVMSRGFVDSTRVALVADGGGAVTAAAVGLRHPELFGAVVMRCSGGGFLAGGSGYDRPGWGEWRYARPYVGSLALWLGRSPLHDATRWKLPLLIWGGSSRDIAGPFDFGSSFGMIAARAGAPVSTGDGGAACRSNGPVSWSVRQKAERAWLERHTRSGQP